MSNQTIAVIDYGMGNLHSAASALEKVAPQAQVLISSDAETIRAADRVVFPGVGAIRDCMSEIRRHGFDQLIAEQIQEKPVLAICVGMQALVKHSEENGGVDGIGLIDGAVRLFDAAIEDDKGNRLKVPHMGWNKVHQADDHPLWQGIEQDSRFYFVHSYFLQTNDPSVVTGTTEYGVELVSAVASGNLFAVQFHPEKSHAAGLQLLENFTRWRI